MTTSFFALISRSSVAVPAAPFSLVVSSAWAVAVTGPEMVMLPLFAVISAVAVAMAFAKPLPPPVPLLTPSASTLTELSRFTLPLVDATSNVAMEPMQHVIVSVASTLTLPVTVILP